MQAPDLDPVFSALSDSVRRGFLHELRAGPRSISQLAATVSISLPAVSRHIKVLEAAGLISREKRGRTHWCSLRTEPLDQVQTWVNETRADWEGRLDRLERLLEDS